MKAFILGAETFFYCKPHHFHPRHIGGTLFCQQDIEIEHLSKICSTNLKMFKNAYLITTLLKI